MTTADSQTLQRPSNENSAALRVRRPIGVLVSRFPLITETFILREIDELERQGQPVVLIPMIRENQEVVHEEAWRWADRAVVVPFLSLEVIRSFLAAWIRKPRAMVDLLVWIVRKTLLRPRILVKSLYLFPKSVYLASWIENRDIRHLHAHFATHPTTMAYIIASLTDVSFSFTVHAHDIFVDRSLLREKIRKAPFVRSISNFNKAFLENLFPRASEGKIRVVHVGIEPERYRQSRDFSRKDGPARVLCIAAMKPYKGVFFLVEAANLLRLEDVDFQLELIGTGPLMKQVGQAIARLGLEDRVHLLGALPQDQVAEKIRDADIFVLPSIIAADGQMEGIPVALMEAMAAGKPVISTSISGIPELVEHEITGLLVDPANPRQLADAICRLIDDSPLRQKLAKTGREKVEAQFDLRRVVYDLIPSFDHVSGFVEEIASVPDIGREVEWGLRRARTRNDSQVFEMMAAAPSGVEELVLKRQLSRTGESRPPRARAHDEVEVLRRLAPHFEHASGGHFGFGVPRVIGFDAGTATIAMERAGETTLEDSIRSARRDPATIDALALQMHKAGNWLAHFQSFERKVGTASLTDEVSGAIQLLRRLDQRKLARAQVERVANRLGALEAQLGRTARPAVAHHGDFWPGNVFISSRALRVIDFEGYRLALPSRDVAWFLLHVGLYLAYRAPRLLELSRARFLEGYGKDPDPGELELSRIASALILLDKDDSQLTFFHRAMRRRYLRRELTR